MSDSNAMMKMKVRKLGGRGHCPRKAKVWDRQLIGQHAPQMRKVVKELIIIFLPEKKYKMKVWTK